MLKFLVTTFITAALTSVITPSVHAQSNSLLKLPQCFDAQGRRVKVIVSTNSEEVPNAQAYYDTSGPVIAINKQFMSNFSGIVQMFIYMHECGHLQLNHPNPFSKSVPQIGAESQMQEIEADCWALKNLNRLYPLTKQNLDDILTLTIYADTHKLGQHESLLLIEPGLDKSHPPGYVRAEALKRCPIR